MPVVVKDPMVPRGLGTFVVRLSGIELRKLHEDRAAIHAARAERGQKKIEVMEEMIAHMRVSPAPARPRRPMVSSPMDMMDDMHEGPMNSAQIAALERAQVEHRVRHVRHDQRQVEFQIEECRRMAAAMRFLASHIDPEQTYEVTDDVIERLMGPLTTGYGPAPIDIDLDYDDIAPAASTSTHAVIRPIRPVQ